MSDVERVKALRDAFVAGLVCNRGGNDARHWMFDLAAELYPMPTIEVPRVVRVKDGGPEYRLADGVLEVRRSNGSWSPSSLYRVDTVRLFSDLMANPTERKPADEVTP